MANVPVAWAGSETGDINLEGNSGGGTNGIHTNTGPHSGTRNWQCNPTTAAVGWFSFAGWSATTGKQVSLNSNATVFVSFFYNPATLPAGTHEIMAGFYTGLVQTTPVITLRQKSDGTLALYDSANTLIATGTTVLTANGGTHTGSTYRIDFSANRTTGAYTVQIEGTVEPNLSGSGASLGATNIGNFCIGKVANTNSNTVDFRYDDIWVDTSAFAPGDYSMVINKPTANGTTMSWTNSDSGTGDFSHVNTVPASQSTFVQDPAGTSLPVIAQFAMQTYAQMGIPVGSVIQGIVVHGFLKDGVSTPANTVKLGVISNGVKSTNSTAQNTSAAYINYGKLLTTDPNTGSAWTQSGIENVQFYVEEGTTAVNTNLAAALITVVYTAPTVKTQLGKARITATTSQTQLGKSRIQVTTTQTMLGKASIGSAVNKTQLGLSRITATTAQLQLGLARITATTLQTQQGRSRITVTTTQTQLGRARITIVTTRTQTGKSRITVTTTQTQLGRARVTAKTTQTILGKAAIALVATLQTIAGKSRIAVITKQTMLGKASIVAPQETDNADFTFPRPIAAILSPPIIRDVVAVRPR